LSQILLVKLTNNKNNLTLNILLILCICVNRMRAVLCLFVLISTALACPCSPPGGCSCGEKPKICNPAWNVRTFDSQQVSTSLISTKEYFA
jgi:hypothetical protein